MAHDRLPLVIDNQQVKLADILNRVMRDFGGRALDVATAYFTVGGFQLVGDLFLLVVRDHARLPVHRGLAVQRLAMQAERRAVGGTVDSRQEAVEVAYRQTARFGYLRGCMGSPDRFTTERGGDSVRRA